MKPLAGSWLARLPHKCRNAHTEGRSKRQVADELSSATCALNTNRPVQGRVCLLEQPERLQLLLFRLTLGGCGVRRRLAPPLATGWLDFVHLGGVGEDVGELSVNCGWGFSTVGFQPSTLCNQAA